MYLVGPLLPGRRGSLFFSASATSLLRSLLTGLARLILISLVASSLAGDAPSPSIISCETIELIQVPDIAPKVGLCTTVAGQVYISGMPESPPLPDGIAIGRPLALEVLKVADETRLRAALTARDGHSGHIVYKFVRIEEGGESVPAPVVQPTRRLSYAPCISLNFELDTPGAGCPSGWDCESRGLDRRPRFAF